jgi:hypothetical protein
MDNKKALTIICLVALFIRLLFAAQSATLAPEAYPTVRQVEHIVDTGLPLFDDEILGAAPEFPLFPYIVAFSALFLPDNLAYIITPNILAVTLHIALFFLILELTNSKQLAFAGSFASIFLPSYLEATLLTVSSLSLAIPLFIVLVTLFLKLRKTKENRNVLLFVFLVLCFTHPIALICFPFLVGTTILTTIRRSKDEVAQLEFALFASFFLLWLYILLYKESLAASGIRTLQANLPAAAQSAVYADVTLVTLATAIGVIPFGLALFAAYKEGVAHHVGIQAILALAVSTALVMLLKIIPLQTGLALFGVVCIVLAAVGLQHIQSYNKGLRKQTLPQVGTALVLILFALTSVLPTITAGATAVQQTVPADMHNAALWLRENSQQDILVLTDPLYASFVQTVSERPVYLTENYLAYSDAEHRYNVAQKMLSGKETAKLANQERIDYIVSKVAITDPCLNIVYKEGIYITKVLCR